MDQLLEQITGEVESVIYQNEENGYTVARVLCNDGDVLTVVGILPCLGAGERISAEGTLTSHPQHGPQFQVESYYRELPDEEEGIYAYLASRTVKGIGPKTAQAIVDRFGTDSFRILAEEPERLSEIKGISRDKARVMQNAFLRLNAMRLLLEFLLRYQLPPAFAAPLSRLYGERAVEFIQDDPYLLCGEEYRLDFAQADRLAEEFGIDGENEKRLSAAILYVLSFNLQSGHTFLPEDKLLTVAATLIGMPEDRMAQQLMELEEDGRVCRDQIAGHEVIYLNYVFLQERFVSEEICRLWQLPARAPRDLQKSLNRQERKRDIEYADLQREAIAMPFSSGISLITGGPGTGKTTALLTLIDLLEEYGMQVLLAAPTGRAAKRMSQICAREAKTLHRLLEAGFDQHGRMAFQRKRENPLSCDVVVVDEASMLDLSLAAALLDALKPHTRLVLVGDADQLPPVGAGSLFSDLLACPTIPRVCLTQVFRQAQDSDIILNAHLINGGETPALRRNTGDFYFSSAASSDSAIQTVVSLMTHRIPGHFGIDTRDIQVICPSRQMACGTVNLNKLLQAALNPPASHKKEAIFGAATFRLGDRVMQIRNNYDMLWQQVDTGEVGTGIYNGDTGEIVALDPAARVLVVRFDDREAEYPFEQLGELEHAYAVTAHKSQGSEYEAVIIPVYAAPERLLSRNLLYTAVTRAKRLLVLVGREEMVQQMIATPNRNRRYCGLKTRVRELCQ